jgi:hypothetical protein|tara:strand:+ start:497 stop:655 length:159 start_codon:yes stop_codon:yes gene_type:complete
MRVMARPLKYDHRLTFRIPYELWQNVIKDADKKKVKPTELLRKIIEERFSKK